MYHLTWNLLAVSWTADPKFPESKSLEITIGQSWNRNTFCWGWFSTIFTSCFWGIRISRLYFTIDTFSSSWWSSWLGLIIVDIVSLVCVVFHKMTFDVLLISALVCVRFPLMLTASVFVCLLLFFALGTFCLVTTFFGTLRSSTSSISTFYVTSSSDYYFFCWRGTTTRLSFLSSSATTSLFSGF